MRLRTIPQVYDHYKKIDPEGALSKRLIRQIAESGDIPVLRSGRKILIDLDVFDRYMSGGAPAKESGGGN